LELGNSALCTLGTKWGGGDFFLDGAKNPIRLSGPGSSSPFRYIKDAGFAYVFLLRGQLRLINPTRRHIMIYADPRTEHAISELQVQLKGVKDAKWYRRLKIIQLSMSGISVQKLSNQFDLCAKTVRNYIKSYNQGGIDELKPQKSPGRPPKVGHLSKDDWSEILSRTPNQYERLETDSRQWTLGLLVRYAKEYIGCKVCFQTISKALRRCKYRTGRSKLRIGSPDPDYLVKRERVEKLRSLPPRGN